MKAAVEHLKEDFAFSERRACDVLHLPVSTFRYRSVRCDAALREKLVELAREKPRFGYRRLHVLLRRDGEQVKGDEETPQDHQPAGQGARGRRTLRRHGVQSPGAQAYA